MSHGDRDPLWSWSQSRSSAGSFESVQRTRVPTPVVERSAAGAKRLGDVYWNEVQRSTGGVVRALESARGVELRMLGIGPALLRFGPPEHVATPVSVTCRHPILGGLLARVPGGSISFSQTEASEVELSSSIEGFYPRLAPRRSRRRWNGVLYPQLQTRLHRALGHRYLARLRAGAAR